MTEGGNNRSGVVKGENNRSGVVKGENFPYIEEV
jgi:hypothetical protein